MRGSHVRSSVDVSAKDKCCDEQYRTGVNMESRYAPENPPREEETLLAPYSQEDVPMNMAIPAHSSGATLKERLSAGMATMEKVSGKQKRPANHNGVPSAQQQAAPPAKQICKPPLQDQPRAGSAHGGQPGAKQIAGVPAEPPVSEQSNPDIALKLALRRLSSNMLKIGERQVAAPHEVWSLMDEQKEIRGMLSARTPLRNSIETFLDLLEALLRAKLQLRTSLLSFRT
ncbi:hypothetical protein pipiens_009743 [Culex pipiens pipiens]|uniref:Uncharacterized protein n=1 Tax=Culex pipiens pipiens TaxID=38569 RepID=A0ABD1DCQ9_CULPP